MLCRLVVLAAAAAAFAPAGLTARTSVAMSATMSKAKLTTMVKGLTKETFESIYEQEAWIVENGGKTWIKKTLKRVDEKAKAFGLTVKPDFLAKEKRTTEEVEAAEVLGEERAAPTAAAWRAACDAEGVTSYADFGITLAASEAASAARAGPPGGRRAPEAPAAESEVAVSAELEALVSALASAPEAEADAALAADQAAEARALQQQAKAQAETRAAEDAARRRGRGRAAPPARGRGRAEEAEAEAAADAEAKAAADLAAERAAEKERLAAKAAEEKAAAEAGRGEGRRGEAAAAEAKAAADLAAERAAEQERLAAKAAAEKAASEAAAAQLPVSPAKARRPSLRAEGQRALERAEGEGASWTTRRLKP
ncbi:hypothetical protein JL720_6531 [Aureococcus anophagefferens]|nr:hypothetical protein JL720_6531 [Aureococcus anophagefferens]